MLPVDGLTPKRIRAVHTELWVGEKKKRKPGLDDEERIWEELGGGKGVVMTKMYCMHI